MSNEWNFFSHLLFSYTHKFSFSVASIFFNLSSDFCKFSICVFVKGVFTGFAFCLSGGLAGASFLDSAALIKLCLLTS